MFTLTPDLENPMTEVERVLLRAMAWERAKGELNSIRHLYYPPDTGFEAISNKIDEFIKDVEDNAIGGFL